MERDRADLASQVESLAARVRALEQRLAALERSATAPAAQAVAPPPVAAAIASDAAEELSPAAVSGTLALAGRSLLVLAGAFVLRSLTESGVLPQSLGAALGVAYGVIWLLFADRAAGAGATLSATFHGLTSTAIVFPLLVEATFKFKFFSAPASAVALLAVSLAGLAVARRRDLAPLLWVMTLGAAATALALGVTTRELVLFAGVLFLIAIAAFAAGARRGWSGPGWLAVALLDGWLLLMAGVALFAPAERAAQIFRLPALVALLLALVALSFGAFITRTWRTRGTVHWQEVAQGAVAIVVGFGGALAVTHRAGGGALAVGLVGLLLAAAAYAASFTFIDRIEGRRVSFVFYTSAALVLTLLGAVSLWRGAPLALALSAAALVTTWLGSTKQRETLSLHATIYLLAAAAAAGLHRLALAALFRPEGPPPVTAAPALPAVLAVAALFCWLPVASHGRTWGSVSRWAKAIVLVVLLIGLDEVAVAIGTALLPHGADGLVSRPALAVLRTALLSVSAVALALMGRSDRLREAAWLVYPLLVVGALKLLLEDLRIGQPAALVLSFALFGGALIVAPRLVRRVAPRIDPTAG